MAKRVFDLENNPSTSQPVKKRRLSTAQRNELKRLSAKWRDIKCEAFVTSLNCHPSRHLCLTSFYDGTIKLYALDPSNCTQKVQYTINHSSLTNPKSKHNKLSKDNKHNNSKKSNNKSKSKGGSLQNFFDDIDFDDLETLPSFEELIAKEKEREKEEESIVDCRHTNWNIDGSKFIGAWNDSKQTISMFDCETSKKLTSFYHNTNNDLNNDDSSNDDGSSFARVTAMRYYNENIIVTGDDNGVIKAWDSRTNLRKSSKNINNINNTKGKGKGKWNGKISFCNSHVVSCHSATINCFESNSSNNKLFAGSSDGQLSVWDLRKSDRPKRIIDKNKDSKKKSHKYLLYSNPKQIAQQEFNKKLWKTEDEIAHEENENKNDPQCLKSISDSMNDEILSLCLFKYDDKLLCGMLSGFINIFSLDSASSGLGSSILANSSMLWYGDRIKGHSESVGNIVKYDDDCVITACSDGLIRLISVYPHRLLHVIGSHDLLSIDYLSLSHDKSYLLSYSNGFNQYNNASNSTNKGNIKGILSKELNQVRKGKAKGKRKGNGKQGEENGDGSYDCNYNFEDFEDFERQNEKLFCQLNSIDIGNHSNIGNKASVRDICQNNENCEKIDKIDLDNIATNIEDYISNEIDNKMTNIEQFNFSKIERFGNVNVKKSNIKTKNVNDDINDRLTSNEWEIIKIWNLNWTPRVIDNRSKLILKEKQKIIRQRKYESFPKMIKNFLEHDKEDVKFDSEDERNMNIESHNKNKNKNKNKNRNKNANTKNGNDKSKDTINWEDYKDSDDSDSDDDDSEEWEVEQVYVQKSGQNKGSVNDDSKENDVDDDDDDDDDEGEEQDDDIDDIDLGDWTEADWKEFDNGFERRIKWKRFDSREKWVKYLGKRKKIRKYTKKDKNKYQAKKFFRDLRT